VVGVDDLTLDLICPSTVVPQAAGGHTDIDIGHGHGLSIVQGLESGQLFGISLDQLRELDEEFASLFWGNLPPCGVKGLSCRGDGNVDILLGGFVDGADDFFG